jgi:hypothetical protein
LQYIIINFNYRSSEYLITSFSIPHSLETENLSQVIEQWKLKLENFELNLKLDESKGLEFFINKEAVKLDKVCL